MTNMKTLVAHLCLQLLYGKPARTLIQSAAYSAGYKWIYTAKLPCIVPGTG